ncbi:MAG: ribbon-helix-helix domain-containing protein [Chloroflexi bacterium]|nr:ribbon-helix-helix domain-containing protein [Chloroflexota bacterium]
MGIPWPRWRGWPRRWRKGRQRMKKGQLPMKAISLRLDENQYERLRVQSFATRQPVSEIIRTAIDAHLKRVPSSRGKNGSGQRNGKLPRKRRKPIWLPVASKLMRPMLSSWPAFGGLSTSKKTPRPARGSVFIASSAPMTRSIAIHNACSICRSASCLFPPSFIAASASNWRC